MTRIERQLDRISEREAELNARAAAAGSDYERLAQIGVLLAEVGAEREALEAEWLAAAEQVE